MFTGNILPYFEPFKSYKAVKAPMSGQKFKKYNIFGLIRNTLGGMPVPLA